MSASSARRRGRGVGEPGLDVADRVVAEVAGKPTAKARQAGPRRGAIATQELADERQRIAFVTLDDAAVDPRPRSGVRALRMRTFAGRPMNE